ncbi:MAG: ABC transporter permease [Phycisphaerae bacterium]|nr:ABC transporter permease [Phycisphaerae bacterium]
MGPSTLVIEALHSLTKNVGRTALSILGIVIGIASVIAMMAVGTGTERAVEKEISRWGDDWIVVWYEGRQRGGVRRRGAMMPNVVEKDVEAIREQCPAVRAASLAHYCGDRQVVSSYGNYNTNIRGVEPSCFDIRRWEIMRGREMTDQDLGQRRKVCWLGMTVVEKLFGTIDPIGKTVRIDRHPFEVCGVLRPKGSSGQGDDADDLILMPLTTAQTLIIGNFPPSVFYAAAKPTASVQEAKEQIQKLLRERHHVGQDEEEPYGMWDRSQLAESNSNITGTFKTLLTFIGSISLLVGGVGIMNIMLVSVTERTREIGVRMAIGAKSRHILTQFLCESVVLCAIGGVFGFGLGYLLAEMTTYSFMEDLTGGLTVECELSYTMVAVAIGVSTGVGIFFGFYPAFRASRLDPIDALRYE